MEKISSDLLALLTETAELRAGGATWASVAAKLFRDAETCRHWPRRFPETWLRLYREAIGHRAAEAAVEAQLYLRKWVRFDDPKVCLRAAQLLQRAYEDHMNREDKFRRPEPARAAADLIEHIQHMKGLSDDQFANVLVKVIADLPAAGAEHASGGGVPPDPPQPE